MSAEIATFVTRLMLVGLFLPFSALDKVLNFQGAVKQAREIGVGAGLGAGMILIGLVVEVVFSLGVVTGVADRLCAVLLAGYCMATAVLYKRWWAIPDAGIYSGGPGAGTFFEFWKNFALAGGFLILALGPTGEGLAALVTDPLGSTHPYSEARP